jgi:hypothetical protein
MDFLRYIYNVEKKKSKLVSINFASFRPRRSQTTQITVRRTLLKCHYLRRLLSEVQKCGTVFCCFRLFTCSVRIRTKVRGWKSSSHKHSQGNVRQKRSYCRHRRLREVRHGNLRKRRLLHVPQGRWRMSSCRCAPPGSLGIHIRQHG